MSYREVKAEGGAECTQSGETGWDDVLEWDPENDVPVMVGRDTEKRLYDTIARGDPLAKRVRLSTP